MSEPQRSHGGALRVDVSRTNPQDRTSGIEVSEPELQPGSAKVEKPAPESKTKAVQRKFQAELDRLNARRNDAYKAMTPVAHEPVRDSRGALVFENGEVKTRPVYTSTQGEREQAKRFLNTYAMELDWIQTRAQQEYDKAVAEEELEAEVEHMKLQGDLEHIGDLMRAAGGKPADGEEYRKLRNAVAAFKNTYGYTPYQLLREQQGG